MLRPSSQKLASICFVKKPDTRIVTFATTRLLTEYQVLRGRPGGTATSERALYCQIANLQTSKWLSSQANTNLHLQEKHPPVSINNAEFKAIYRLPYIHHVRFLSRLKLAQTIFVVGIVPPLGIVKYMDLISDAQIIFPVCVASFALLMLYCMSFYLRRIIGIMYINQNGSKLKVSHLDFWGRRQDFVVEVKDVLSASEIGDSKEVLMRKFQTFDSKKYFYFTLKYGKILDEQIFYDIFGRPH